MSEFSFSHPPVEVVSASPRLEMISGRLRTSGLSPCTHRKDARPNDPILIDGSIVDESLLRSLEYRLERSPDRPIIMLGRPQVSVNRIDIQLDQDGDLLDLPRRLSKHNRIWLRRNEAQLRESTAAALGQFTVPAVLDGRKSHQILYVGDGSPKFLGLQSELRRHDIALVPTLSTRTAQDYLHSQEFSLILLDLTSADAPGHHFLTQPTLTSVPIIALMPETNRLPEDAQACLARADEIMSAQSSIPDLAHQIALALSRHDANCQIETHVANSFKDPMTGTFSQRFFEVHLENQMKVSEIYETPLCLVTFELRPTGSDIRDAQTAIGPFSKSLKPMTRRTDCLARIAPNILAVSLRQTGFAGACKLGQTITDYFSTDQGASVLNFDGTIMWRAVERRLYHKNSAELIGAALERPYRKLRTNAA